MDTKKCRICEVETDLDCFNLHHVKGRPYVSDKHRMECKECQYKKCKEYREANKEKLKKYREGYKPRAKAWREKHFSDPENREKARAYSRAYYYEHNRLEPQFDNKIKRNFGITRSQYDYMLEQQNGGCAICSAKAARKKATHLAVDHDHATGKVRGLLCTRCNRAIGSFHDNPDLLRKAATYLEQ